MPKQRGYESIHLQLRQGQAGEFPMADHWGFADVPALHPAEVEHRISRSGAIFWAAYNAGTAILRFFKTYVMCGRTPEAEAETGQTTTHLQGLRRK